VPEAVTLPEPQKNPDKAVQFPEHAGEVLSVEFPKVPGGQRDGGKEGEHQLPTGQGAQLANRSNLFILSAMIISPVAVTVRPEGWLLRIPRPTPFEFPALTPFNSVVTLRVAITTARRALAVKSETYSTAPLGEIAIAKGDLKLASLPMPFTETELRFPARVVTSVGRLPSEEGKLDSEMVRIRKFWRSATYAEAPSRDTTTA